MHRPVRERLEELLQGQRDPQAQAHLEACPSCRERLAAIRRQSELLHCLKPPPVAAPAGFYGRVMKRIEAERKISIWELLLDPVFGRRLVLASAALVLLMGVYLVATEPSEAMLASAPEQMLSAPEAAPPAPMGANPEQDRSVVFVSLATFEE